MIDSTYISGKQLLAEILMLPPPKKFFLLIGSWRNGLPQWNSPGTIIADSTGGVFNKLFLTDLY